MARWAKVVAVSAVAVAVGVVPATTGQAKPQPSGLRLVAVLHHADVTRYGDLSQLPIPPAVYFEAVGGAFEVDARSRADGTVSLSRVSVDATGARLVTPLHPPRPVSMSDGLPAFFRLVLRDPAGKVAARGDSPFCPSGGWGLSRIDGSGPDRATYPYYCGGPLTRAIAWGVDRGWAVPVTASLDAPDVPDGDYVLTLSVNPAWAKQLKIPPAQTRATMSLTVTTDSGDPCPPEIVCEAGTSAGAARSRSGARAEGPGRGFAAERQGDQGQDGPGGLPNMEALPAHDFSTEHNADDGRDYLDFGATIWNGGTGPLVVEGFRSGDSATMTAVQFIYRNGAPQSSATIGQFEFDRRPGHNHWHMEDVAQYDLLDASGGRVVLSDKQSFCLAPTDPVDLLSDGADWQPDRIGLYSACGGEEAIWLREALPAGWGDTYYQSVAGQSFDITDLPNGRYQVRVTTDPFHRLLETSYDDNSARVTVVLGGTPGARTVTMP